MSLSNLKKVFSLAALLLAAPLLCLPAIIQVNGTCEVGAGCPTVDSITNGGSVGPTNFNFNTSVNGDAYNFNGTYSASYVNGTHLAINFSTIYTGTLPTATNDVLTLDIFQNYNTPGATSWDGNYSETIPVNLGTTTGASSSVTGDAYYDQTHDVGPLTFTGPGFHSGQKTTDLTGLTGATLDADFRFTLDFTAGTLSGGTITVLPTSVPEPSQAAPVCLVLAGLFCTVLVRRRIQASQRM